MARERGVACADAVVTFDLARAALIDIPALALAAVSAVLLFRFKVNSAWLVLGGAGLGLAIETLIDRHEECVEIETANARQPHRFVLILDVCAVNEESASGTLCSMAAPARVSVLVTISCSIALAVACGSGGDSTFGSSGGSSGSSGDGTSNGGFGTGDGGTSGASSGASGASGSSGGNCFAPVDMYLMFDKSGSMGDPAGNGATGDCNIGDTKNSKWCHAINALSGYLNSPTAKDQAAALQFFSGTDNANCATGAPYDKPAIPATEFTTLPSNAFDAPLNATVPGGATPMEAALRGLTTFTAANRRPGHVTIGILITDGDPQGCNQNLTFLSGLLDAHYQATKIRTYVIGMNGATFANLEKIAAGGNGPTHAATVGALTGACGNVAAPCRFWNVGDGDPAGFIQALAAIQQSADGCNPGGGTVNPPK
jgi:hypothetical protein